MGKQTFRERIPAFASILGLLVLIAAYYIVGAVRDANVAYGLKAVINQSVVVALVATGAVFIYTLGSFDISLGAATGVSALLGAMAYNATGSLIIMFLVCLGVAVAIGFIIGVVQDSVETALNSSGDAMFTAAAEMHDKKDLKM